MLLTSSPSEHPTWGPADIPHTLVDLLRRRAMDQPDRVAFTFLADGETEAGSFTHASLDTRARAIGAWLSSISCPGDRALLLLPSGLDFVAGFFGCLYAGLAAVPAYPLDPARLARTVARLETIIDDCQPVVALTDAASLRAIEGLIPGNPSLQHLRWIEAETVADECAENWRSSSRDPGAVAVIQYTSGSTKAPRGVMVSHRNALENMEMFRRTYGHSGESTFVGWLPLAHDLGLFGHAVLPLYVGALSVLMTPEAFIRSPSRWIKVMARYHRVVTHAPNFAYGLAAKRSTAEELAGLDLSGLHTASLGGEPIRLETIDLCTSSFERCGFRRNSFVGSYGLAEATLLVSAARDPQVLRLNPAELERDRIVQEPDLEAPARVLVSVGPPTAGQKIAIVDLHTAAECPPGHVGEVWVSGPNIALGYWNKPTDTEHTFRAYIKDTHEGPFLRTGDLGFLHNGELFITGRLKDLIILNGRNHYPQDFEFTVENCDKALRPGCTAAFSVETGNEEHLVVVQELRDPNQTGLSEIVAKIKSALFQNHGVAPHAVVLVPAGVVPKTSSGKIQRQACRTSYLSDSLPAIHRSLDSRRSGDSLVAPRTPAETTLAGIWSVALGLDSSAIGVHDSFFDLGGDSLAAISSIAQICDAFHLPDVPPEIFLYAPTLAQMAKVLVEPQSLADCNTQVLPIQPNGSGIPVVIVSPGIEFRHIAKNLGQQHPVFGIRGERFAHRARRPSLAEIAVGHVDALRRFRPHGPYAICGWCSFAAIAFEMARCLEGEGEQVAFVAMLDARSIYFPPMPRRRRLLVRSRRFAEKLVFLAKSVTARRFREIRRAVGNRVCGLVDFANRARRRPPPSEWDALMAALREWSPQPWHGRVLHLWSSQRPRGRFHDAGFLWGGIAPNGVFFEVPGDHFSRLHDPNVDSLTQILASEFDRHRDHA